MNPTTPTSAMSQGGTFMRPGAMAWGQPGPGQDPQAAAGPATPAAIEHALAAAAKDPGQVTDLLDELSRGRLWLPLPEVRPVTDGSAVVLPTVTYLGAEFVPAFTSAGRLAGWLGQDPVPPFAASVPIYPEGVGYLAATLVVSDGTLVRVGRPPADPLPLLSEVRTALSAIPDARQASRAWLSVSGQGEGLVISVTLDDPGSQDAHQEVVDAVQRAVAAVPELRS